MKKKQRVDCDINNYDNPSDTSVYTAPETSLTKGQTQCPAYLLKFDLLVGRRVSVDYPELLPTLFLQWKDSLPHELSYFPQYDEVPAELRNLADRIIDRLAGEIDTSLTETCDINSISANLNRFLVDKHRALKNALSIKSAQLGYNTQKARNELQSLEEELAQLSPFVNQPGIDFAEMSVALYHQFREYFFSHQDDPQLMVAGYPEQSSTSEKCQVARPLDQFRFKISPVVIPQNRADETEEYNREDSFGI